MDRGGPDQTKGGAQDAFKYTYYKLSYDTSHQSALSQNANDNDIDNVSQDSYHLRYESADELDAPLSADELDGKDGVKTPDSVYNTVLHIDEEKLMAEVREEERLRELQEQQENGEVAGEGENRQVAEEVREEREVEVEMEPARNVGFQETNIDEVPSPIRTEVPQGRKVEVEIIEKEQEKIYNRTPSLEKAPAFSAFSRSESEGNESTANERVPVSTNERVQVPVNGTNEIQYVLHRRHVEPHHQQPQANGRVSRPLQKTRASPQKVSREQARLQLEQVKTDLRTTKKSPRDRSPGSSLVRISKLPPKDSVSCADDSVSPTKQKEIISQYTIHAKYERVHRTPSPPKVARISSPTKSKSASPTHRKQAQNDLNKPTPPKKPPRTSSNVETNSKEERRVNNLQGTQRQKLMTAVAPKAEMEDLTPTTDTDSDSSGGRMRQPVRGCPRRGAGESPRQSLEETPRRAVEGSPSSTIQAQSSSISHTVASSMETVEKTSLVSSVASVASGTKKDVNSPISEETFSAIRGQDLPFADAVPHFSDEDEELNNKNSERVSSPSDEFEQGLEDSLNVAGLEQDEFSDLDIASPENQSPAHKPSKQVRIQDTVVEEYIIETEDEPPPVPTCPPPDDDLPPPPPSDSTQHPSQEDRHSVSSDSECERPFDEDLPDIHCHLMPGVSRLQPPAGSIEVVSDAEDEDAGGDKDRHSISSDSECERPFDEGVPDIHCHLMPGVSRLQPPVGSIEVASDAEDEDAGGHKERHSISSDSECERPFDEGIPDIHCHLMPGVSRLQPPAESIEIASEGEDDAEPVLPSGGGKRHSISSDSECERPFDEEVPDIHCHLMPGVSRLQPPAGSIDIASEGEEDEEEGQEYVLEPEPPKVEGTLHQSKPITAIPEEEEELVEMRATPSAPPPTTQFKYVRSDSDIPPPPPPVELYDAAARIVHDISSEEEVEHDIEEHHHGDLEARLLVGQHIPPPVAPTEISSESDAEIPGEKVEGETDLDAVLASPQDAATAPPPSSNLPAAAEMHDISSEEEVAYDDRTDEVDLDDIEAALTAGKIPPPIEISSEEEVNYPSDEEIHGDIQEALKAGKIPPPVDFSSGSDEEHPDHERLSDIDKFEKKFELHIEEDEESVQCLPEGAEHLITAVEGAESLSQSGLGSDSSSSESGMEMKGAMGGIHTGGLPLEISSESDGEAPVEDDLPDPTDILESNVFANPYNLIQGEEFSELPPPPPPPPGYVPRENIIDQYYSSVGAGSMQISGPSGIPPLPPARVSSIPQQSRAPPRTAPKPAPPVPARAAYEQLQSNDLSDNSSEGENPHDDSMDSADRLEALESLDQAYIVHHSDSSDEGGKAEDSGSESSSSDGDFEEVPGDIVRQRQLARHHVGVEVRPNRRYQNQINMHVSDNGHVYQNVPVRNGSHVYQNVSAMARDPSYQNAGVVTSQHQSQHVPQQQSHQQRRPQQLHQQHQGGVISNPYAESFGAQSSSGRQHSPSQPPAHSPSSPSGGVPGQGPARSSRGSHSSSD